MTTRFYETVIIGTGFSGIAAARELLVAGHSDFLILEQAEEVGGVWRENRYPNAACDVPAHLYSLSFSLNPEWSCNFAGWSEILAYMNAVVDELGIREQIAFDTKVVAAHWDGDLEMWEVTLDDATALRCKYFISGVGAISRPLIPDLPGMSDFRGEIIHTAKWHSGIDLSHKRVAVIGAGASAIQVVPYAVDSADAVLAVIRTAPYVVPKPEEFYDEEDKRFFREHPEVLQEKRRIIYDEFNISTDASAAMDAEFLDRATAVWKQHMESAIEDPELRRILTPDYRYGCRRPALSNIYYPALANPKTTVWDDVVVAFTESGVVGADGREWDADVVVLATGFRATEMFAGVTYSGARGVLLHEKWAGTPEAYKGTLVPEFPNLFLMAGPNTQAAGSIIGVIEAQARMVVDLITTAECNGSGTIQVTEQAQREYNDWLDEKMAGSVWEAGGCRSWYRVDGSGKVVIRFPASLAAFERLTARIDADDILFGGAGTAGDGGRLVATTP
ncbi:NAD(P)/FAD-dependent oxidoreductase [Microbacterium sp. 1P10UB]|uniref:flavin-containing monooxygenase n=1 Tax=unclassified Microbacterium TaxID=2609290 RepID=UPI00399FB1D0